MLYDARPQWIFKTQYENIGWFQFLCSKHFNNEIFIFKIVQEYERAVIFRVGRLRPGGAKGPGI